MNGNQWYVAPAVLHSAMAVNADAFRLHRSGHIQKRFKADLIISQGTPAQDIHAIRRIRTVIKDGKIIKEK